MKNKSKKFLFSFISLLLVCIMSFMTACANIPKNDGKNEDNAKDEESTIITPPDLDDSNLEDYGLNQSENFVYSLIYSDLKKQYDTFVGCITLQNGEENSEPAEVYGISYVDYEEGYVDDMGKTYFSAGFIGFQNDFGAVYGKASVGAEIVSVEEKPDEMFSYVYAYGTEDVHMHCVIDNKYVKYDIEDGEIVYEEEPYKEGMDIDLARGNLYNYDIEDYVYIVEELDYVPVYGTSLLGEADYEEIIAEVNKILRTQEANFTYAELESYVVQSQEALYSYLLGLQEETFLGIPTSELVRIVEDLDPMQHLQIGVDENGATTIEIIEVTKLATLWEKIATSLVCAFGIVGGFVCNSLGLSVFGGAIVGASMEVFMQVVINNTPVSDIGWAQVAVAAVSGAIAGGVSKAINGIAARGVGQLFMREVTDTVCDSIIGGSEFFVNSLIAGHSFEEACKNFGYGVIAGAIISGGVKLGASIIKGGTKLIKKTLSFPISNVGDRPLTKLGTDTAGELEEKTIQKAVKKNTKEAVDGIMKYYDESGKLYRSGNNLLANNEYVKNGYKYFTDDQGRIVNASGELYLKNNKRLPISDSMDDIGKGSQQLTDHRGHLIGDRFGGSNGLENLVPQSSKLNQVEYKTLEETWAKALKEGKKVCVDIDVIYKGDSFRPYTFKINYTIDENTFESLFRNI